MRRSALVLTGLPSALAERQAVIVPEESQIHLRQDLELKGKELKRQHDDLRQRNAKLRELIATSDEQSIESALDQIERTLLDHFTMEEAGGYMSALLEGDPSEESRVRRLRGEHDNLWGRLHHLRKLITGRAPLDEIRVEVKAWATALERHESEENQLIEDHHSHDRP